MSLFASVNGAKVIRLSLGIPLLGLWQADATIDLPDLLTGPVTLVVGNLALVGAVVRQGSFAGEERVLLVGGAGGWRHRVPAASYTSPNQLRLSTLLLDLAAACGEQIAPPSPDSFVGSFFVREAAPASRILRQLVGTGWYVDDAGVTQVGPRPTAAIASPFTVETFDTADGQAVIATEDYASWLPGATFSCSTVPTPQAVSFVRHDLTNEGRLRSVVLVSP